MLMSATRTNGYRMGEEMSTATPRRYPTRQPVAIDGKDDAITASSIATAPRYRSRSRSSATPSSPAAPASPAATAAGTATSLLIRHTTPSDRATTSFRISYIVLGLCITIAAMTGSVFYYMYACGKSPSMPSMWFCYAAQHPIFFFSTVPIFEWIVPAIKTERSAMRPVNHVHYGDFAFALVADLDVSSRDPTEFLWHSLLKKGTLHVEKRSKEEKEARNTKDKTENQAVFAQSAFIPNDTNSTSSWKNFKVTVSWNDTIKIYSDVAANNRSMELSDMVWWNGKYLVVCDYTGMVYKIRPNEGDVFPRFVLADGDGKTSRKLKSEWMTRHRLNLIVGSHGKEWIKDGEVLGRGAEWGKVINPSGTIRSHNWRDNYAKLRQATNTTLPGYLSHEAVLWHPAVSKWIFLPRKLSYEPYDDLADEQKGANIMLVVSEDFSDIKVHTVGPLEPTYGFSSLALVPGSSLMLALKVREQGLVTHTKMTVINLEGKIVLEPEWIDVSDHKFEGAEFIGSYENW